MKRVLFAFCLVASGCAGGEKKEAKTADDEAAPPPPSDEKIQEAKAKNAKKQEDKALAAESPAKAKKMAVVDRADFDATVQKWEAARKDKNGLTKAEAKSLSGKF